MRTADVVEFLIDRGIEAPIFRQGDEPDMPDLVVFLTWAGGLDLTYEHLLDRPAMRVMVRGDQSNPDAGEELAEQIDAALLDAPAPVTIGGRHVTQIQRLGGPPDLVGLDNEQARRPIFSAVYVFEIAR
jgi:hypothetical protein